MLMTTKKFIAVYLPFRDGEKYTNYEGERTSSEMIAFVKK